MAMRWRHFIVTLRQSTDKVVGQSGACRGFNFFQSNMGLAVGDIVADRVVE
jgi:hypothetical protein